MGFFSERFQKQAAIRKIAVSDDEELRKAADDRYEAASLAAAVAEDQGAPEDVRKAAVQDPEWYLEGAGVDIAADLKLTGGDDASLFPDEIEKSYVGFAKLVSKLMAEGKTRDQAEGIAADAGRKKYGARFGQAARSGTKLG